MEKKPKLTVLHEKLRGKSFEIDRDTTSVGRRDTADVCLPDGSVSGHHADIIRTRKNDEVVYILRDNDSTNGTKVNNEAVTEVVLKNSDLITFGHVEVLFDGVDASGDDTHVTHTIDLGSATTNTTTTQTLTNFSARMMAEKKKNERTNAMLNVVLIAGGVLVLGIAVYVLFLGR